MKVIAIGDIHGRDIWKKIIDKEEFGKLVFIGDYFDSFQIGTEQQINNFLDICEFKKSRPDDIIMLIGNHDHHYIVGNNGTSGFQVVGSFQICPVISHNLHLLQMAYQHDNIIFSHAGIGEGFLDSVFGKGGWNIETMVDQINELERYKPRSFIFNGWESSGDNMGQTSIWIRPRSLMRDSQVLKKAGLIQVVGHTVQKDGIDIEGKATGKKYFFIDTLGYGKKEYLIIKGKNFRVGKV